jgi:RecB family exonuclease
MRVSYTQLDTYKQCPRKFRFYIDKAPQDPSRTIALRFGSAVHKALEFAYAKRFGAPAIPRVIEYYRKLMEAERDPKALALFEKGIPALQRYLEANDPRELRVLAVEQKFSMPLTDAHEIVGVIDRLDMLPDGSFEIIDYKTGSIGNAEKLSENWQLAIYQMVKQRQLQTKRLIVSLVYIMYDGHKLTYQFGKEELKRIREDILAQIEVMERDREFPTRTGSWCAMCPYQPICPAWTHRKFAENVVTGKERERDLVEIQAKVDRLLELVAQRKRLEEEIAALKEALAVFARERKLTRLFSDLGTVSFSFRRKAVYDVAGLVEVLRADILQKIVRTIDGAKLDRALPYLSEEERKRIEAFRKEEEQTSVTVRPRMDEETETLLTP